MTAAVAAARNEPQPPSNLVEKLAAVMANNFFCVAVALASIYAIFKLSSGV